MPDFAVRTAFTATDKISPAFNRMGNAADRFSKRASGAFAGLAGQLGLFGGVALAAMGLKKVATSAMMIEDAQAAFTPLLGSVEKATQLVDMLNVAAAETPFQFDALSKTTKQLLPVMNGDLNNTIATMKMLGDTAGGNAQKLESITRGYTKAMLKGKVDMESLNMIAEAGVPIHTELAKSMGYGKDRMSEFFKRVSAGKVSTDDLNNSFKKMTSEGGIFFRGMIIASKTTSGVLSTMSDNLTMTAAAIGTELLPTFKDIAMAVSDAAGSTLKFIKENKGLIRTIVGVAIPALKYTIGLFIAWKFWTWAVISAQKVMMAAGWVKYLWMMKDVIWQAVLRTNAWAVAQKAINFLLAANPIGLVITAIAALGYAIYDLYSNWDIYSLNFQIGIQEHIFQWKSLKYQVLDFLNTLGLVSEEAKKASLQEAFKSMLDLDQLKVDKFRKQIARGDTPESVKIMSMGKTLEAPNRAATELQAGNTNVNIYSNGTEAKAEVTPRRGATVNMNRLGYQQ